MARKRSAVPAQANHRFQSPRRDAFVSFRWIDSAKGQEIRPASSHGGAARASAATRWMSDGGRAQIAVSMTPNVRQPPTYAHASPLLTCTWAHSSLEPPGAPVSQTGAHFRARLASSFLLCRPTCKNFECGSHPQRSLRRDGWARRSTANALPLIAILRSLTLGSLPENLHALTRRPAFTACSRARVTMRDRGVLP